MLDTYRIVITRKEKDPDFAAKMDKYKSHNNGFNNRFPEHDPDYPKEWVAIDTLVTEITPEQFAAIRKAVLEKF